MKESSMDYIQFQGSEARYETIRLIIWKDQQ